MHTDENNAIRYLMKEMDPSEEMEFEKQLREDENLLIEVESLRVTNQKLSVLSLKNPPKHLTKKITDDATQLQSGRVNNTYNVAFLFKRGLAAAILLAAFTGGYYFYSDFPDSPQPAASDTENVDPWVDRNEVIRFSENGLPAQTPTIQTEFTKSYEKLQLVNDPATNSTSNNRVLLTGSSN